MTVDARRWRPSPTGVTAGGEVGEELQIGLTRCSTDHAEARRLLDAGQIRGVNGRVMDRAIEVLGGDRGMFITVAADHGPDARAQLVVKPTAWGADALAERFRSVPRLVSTSLLSSALRLQPDECGAGSGRWCARHRSDPAPERLAPDIALPMAPLEASAAVIAVSHP